MNNTKMVIGNMKMYEKLGYVNVGEANWRKGKFYLLEKKI